MLDNLSFFAPWFSDALCRVATGQAGVHRVLYADADISVQRAMVIANDRRCRRSTPTSPTASCRSTFQPQRQGPPQGVGRRQRFADAWPAALGELCTIVASVLNLLPQIDADLPRMADFGVVLLALGRFIDRRHPDVVLRRYREVSEDLIVEIVEGNQIAHEIIGFAAAVGDWEGQMADLLEQLNARSVWAQYSVKGWPRTAMMLSTALTRSAAALRLHCVGVDRRTVHGTRLVRISFAPPSRSSRGEPHPAAPNRTNPSGCVLHTGGAAETEGAAHVAGAFGEHG